MSKFKYHEGNITSLEANQHFVFGSNLAGRHGKGAALYARRNFGAMYGKGVGFSGSTYAIPTKDKQLQVLPLSYIDAFVAEFEVVTRKETDRVFYVTQIGCGLAGYSPEDIAPMFKGCNPNNTIFDIAWKEYLE